MLRSENSFFKFSDSLPQLGKVRKSATKIQKIKKTMQNFLLNQHLYVELSIVLAIVKDKSVVWRELYVLH